MPAGEAASGLAISIFTVVYLRINGVLRHPGHSGQETEGVDAVKLAISKHNIHNLTSDGKEA